MVRAKKVFCDKLSIIFFSVFARNGKKVLLKLTATILSIILNATLLMKVKVQNINFCCKLVQRFRSYWFIDYWRIRCKYILWRQDSTDDKAGASYPGDPGFETSHFHAAACLRRIINRRQVGP